MTETWRDSLPEEMRNSPALQKLDSLEALATAYTELERYQGTSIRIPSESASEADLAQFHERLRERVPGLVPTPVPGNQESVDAFWTTMGRPEDATGYDAIDGLSDDQAGYMRTAALEANLTAGQYRAMVGKLAENMAAEQAEAKAAADGERQAWFDTLGEAKDQTIVALKLFADQVGMDESLKAAIGEDGNPKVMAFLDVIRKKIGSEGSEMQRQLDSGGDVALTPAEAEAEIGEIMNRPEYMDPQSTVGAQLRARHRELEAMVVAGTQRKRA